MAQRSNAYNFSGDLARIGSALSRAMIGDAQDDANIARAGYYDAQKEGQEYSNTLARQLGDAGAALAENPQFQGVIARAMNLDTINPQFMGPPSDSQMRTGTPAASNLARTFLGEYGNAEQMAGAASTYGDAGASRMFEAMIAGGDGDAMRRGFIGLGNNPTKYFDQGIAQTEIQNTRDVGMDSNQKVLEAANFRTTEQETTKRNKPIILGQDQVAFDVNGVRIGDAAGPTSPDKPIILKTGETAFGVDGTKIASVAGGPQIIKLNENQVAMVEDADSPNGYKEIRGSNEKPPRSIVASPGQTVVTIGNDGKVIDTKTVKDDPITVKANEGQTVQLVVDDPENPGQKKVIYELQGQPKANSTTSTSTDFTLSASDDNALRDAVDTALANNNFKLPDSITRAVRDVLVEQSMANMGTKKNIPRGKNYISAQLRKGFTEIEVPNTGTFYDDKVIVPNFMLEKLRDKIFGKREEKKRANFKYQEQFARLKDKSKQQIKERFTRLGYSDAEVNAIIGAL